MLSPSCLSRGSHFCPFVKDTPSHPNFFLTKSVLELAFEEPTPARELDICLVFSVIPWSSSKYFAASLKTGFVETRR